MENEPFQFTDENFDHTVKNHNLVLVDFWAGWCGPCRALTPIISELAKEYTDKVFVGKLNVDENPQTAEKFEVFSIPTVIILKDGCEVDRIVGMVPKNNFVETIQKYI